MSGCKVSLILLLLLPAAIHAQSLALPGNISLDTLEYPTAIYGWKKGMEVPNLYLLDINLHPFELDDLLSEKPVLIDFWFMACPPCRENNTILKKIHKTGKVHILSISIDENLPALKQFIKAEELDWHHVQDKHPYPRRFKNRIGLGAYYPDYLLIGRDGIVIRRWQENLILRELKRAVKESP
jgi:cytochrome oxidase Cu insertion factor (SCO1/SenC/PrrC family)